MAGIGAPHSGLLLEDSSNSVIFDAGSQFLVDDGSFTAKVVAVRPHASVAVEAIAFLTAREERLKTEEAAIAAAHAGRFPPS